MCNPPDGAGQFHVEQAAVLLWTARRADDRAAINRLPIDPSWDESGLRVELVRLQYRSGTVAHRRRSSKHSHKHNRRNNST